MKSAHDIFLLELDIKIKNKSPGPDTSWLKRAAQSQWQKLGTDIFKW